MKYSAHKFQEIKAVPELDGIKRFIINKLHFQMSSYPFPQVLVCVVFSQPDLWFESQKVFLDALVLP